MAQGRCLFREHQNPGLEQDYRCQELLALEGAYDSLLARVEAFDLDEGRALRLVAAHMEELAARRPGCGKFRPVEPGAPAPLGCALLHGDVCLATLPACAGRCPQYEPLEAAE